MGCHFLLQGILPTQGLNPGLSHCRQTLYRLSHQEVLKGDYKSFLFTTVYPSLGLSGHSTLERREALSTGRREKFLVQLSWRAKALITSSPPPWAAQSSARLTFLPDHILPRPHGLRSPQPGSPSSQITSSPTPTGCAVLGQAHLPPRSHPPPPPRAAQSSVRLTFLPALGDPSQLVVLFPKLSQFLTLLLQFIFQL